MRTPVVSRPLLCIVGAAAVLTLLNVPKPLTIDDPCYLAYARQLAAHPFDPYGFEFFWYDEPLPAMQNLAPPGLPFWLAPAVGLFPQQPWIWKAWLFPFALTLAAALYLLLRRFARGLEAPLTWMSVLSPYVLPGFNLMLDVPALGLTLAAVEAFLRACDRLRAGASSVWLLAACAGLLAGVGAQTKYTGLVAPAVMLLYAGLWGIGQEHPWGRSAARPLVHAAVAALAAATVFVVWEALMASTYGESHFLYHYRQNAGPFLEKLALWPRMLAPMVGALGPAIGLVGLVALTRSARAAIAAGAAVVCGLFLVASADVAFVARISPAWSWARWLRWFDGLWTLEQVVFGSFGLALGLVLVCVAWRSIRGLRGLLRPAVWRARSLDWFLVSWLGVELAAFVSMTLFMAARRTLGILVVATLLAGRLASRTCRAPRRRALIHAAAAGGVALGVLFCAVDYLDASARRQAAERAAAWIRQREPEARIGFVGHWGFRFYAERAGLHPVVVGDPRHPLLRGQWLIVPDPGQSQQAMDLDATRLALAHTLPVTDGVPLRTVRAYYGTNTGAPLEHRAEPRITLSIYRVVDSFVPQP